MEQNNFNGQEQILQNNTVHHQPPHEPTFTKRSTYEPESQQMYTNNEDRTSPIAQQSASSYNIHRSNPQYTSPIHNGASYEHNTSSYENGNTNGNAPLNNGNHISHNKKSKSYGYFMLMALLVAIVITAVVIGAGWAVFYPKPTTSRQTLISPNSSTIITQDDTSATDTDTSSVPKDVVIIYGGNNNMPDTATKKSASQTNRNAPTSSPSPSPVQKTIAAPTASVTKTTTTVAAKKLSPPTPPPAVPVPSTPSEYTNTTKYWIQVFSTNNRDKATQIKKTLDEQGIKATVVTKTINNKIYYRLRIGPYYNKDEGHKFLEWVKRNDKYKDAYISVDRS